MREIFNIRLGTAVVGCFLLCIWSNNIFGQMSLNGTALSEGGGSPSSCGSGDFKANVNAGDGAGVPSANCIQFTNAVNESGSVWACDPIDLDNAFTLSFNMFLGSDNNAGDGIAFVLQSKGVPQIRGGRGGGMGWQQGDGAGCMPSGSCPVSPSVIVEFDTFDNGAFEDNELACDHVLIAVDGNDANNLMAPACMDGGTGTTNFEDGATHSVNITWNPAGPVYCVYVDGVSVLEYNGDIRSASSIDKDAAQWGFTSSTAPAGGLPQTQYVCDVAMTTGGSPSCGIPAGIARNNFRATLENEVVYLNWKEDVEKEAYDYYVEHSMDGVTWNTIGHVTDMSYSEEDKPAFEFMHSTPGNGLNLYRVKYEEENLVKYTVTQGVNLTTEYNLVMDAKNKQLIIPQELNEDLLEVVIYNSSGKIVYQGNPDNNIDLSSFTTGIYVVKSNRNNNSKTNRIVIW